MFMTKLQNRSVLIKLLKTKFINYIESINENNNSIIITPTLGGRIIGACIDDKNLLWVNPDLSSDWNSGGQRSWYAPEWGPKSIYAKGDETTWSVPEVMDPGTYKIINHIPNKTVEMKNDFNVLTTDNTQYHFSMNRRITLLNNDCDHSPYIPQEKTLLVEFEHRLENRGKTAINKEIGLWSILQVNPPGKIIVPLKNTYNYNFFCDNYYEKIPEERIRKENNFAIVYVDGARRYKLGFPPDKVLGKIAYVSKFNDDRYYFILKSFDIPENAVYVDKPYKDKRADGDVIQIYNHSEGGDMAFSELEIHAPAPFLLPGESQSFKIYMLFMIGTKEEIIDVLEKLLDSKIEPRLF